jgi:hypothetical protein
MQTTKRLTTLCAAMLAMILLTSCSLQAASAPSPDQAQRLLRPRKQRLLRQPLPSIPHRNPRRNLHRSQRRNRKRFPCVESDTQTYTAADNDTLAKCAVDQRHAKRIQYGIDRTHRGYRLQRYKEYQWQNATAAFSLLPKGMHIVTVAGNHDQLPDYDKHTPFLDHRVDTDFDPAHASDATGYNYYTAFSGAVFPLSCFRLLRFRSGCDRLDQPNLQKYADHYAVLCVHSYMSVGGYSSIGRRLIEGVVKKSPNIRLVLSGHEGGMVYFAEELDDNGDGTTDRTVHQMMMNLQDDLYNGVGYLRILRLDPNTDTLEVITYSPVLDLFGYKSYVGDQFGEKKILEDAGIRDFAVKSPSVEH